MAKDSRTGSSRRRYWHAVAPLAFVALVLFYIWIIKPTGWRPVRISPAVAVLFIPVVSTVLRRDGLRELGLRFDNVLASVREVGLATLAGAVLILIVGFTFGDPRLGTGMWMAFLALPVWAFAQQYALQSFIYRRLRMATEQPRFAAFAAAALFAAVHLPNPALTVTTAVAAYVWCRLFERNPNLLALAVSHGVLAAMLRLAWPPEWVRGMRIGPSFWDWTP